MNKFLFLSIVFAALGKTSFSQFYYKDIVATKQAVQELSILKEQKLRAVKVTSLEDDGLESEGYIIFF
jgi:hypothetical protein